MDDWSHGYDVSVGYTHGFYREMGPDWLDLCARVTGHVPPRREATSSFRYLDLGTGQGLGLCLLAAANPQGEFVGIDFHPQHIAHAQSLAMDAGLTNIRFVEADFLDLAKTWPEELGVFDYVALHGILSWIPLAVRYALTSVLAHSTKPGALIYNSYNAQPGWLATVPFQHLAQRLKATSSKAGAEVLQDAVGLFDKLEGANAPIFKIQPALKVRLDNVKKQDPRSGYLIQEYLHENWYPLWHTEVADEMAGAKLGFVGSATMVENLLPDVLSEDIREIIKSQKDPGVRQDLQDIATNQAFRRDIFCRGPRRRLNGDLAGLLATPLYMMTNPPADQPVKIEATFGNLMIDYAEVAEVLEALGKGSKTIAELTELPSMKERGWAKALQTLLMLLHARVIMVGAADGRGKAAPTQRLNAAIAKLAGQGAPYKHLASSKLGSAISASEMEMVIIDSWLSTSGKADAATIAKGALDRLTRLGRALRQDNKPMAPEDAQKRMLEMSSKFLSDGVPRLRALGVLP